MDKTIIIDVEHLTDGYGERVINRDVTFQVHAGEILCIMGPSGCGKSTLLKHIIGLYRPMSGDVKIFGESIVRCDEEERRVLMRRFGVTYQNGALFGSMTLGENVALPLEEYTDLSAEAIREKVLEKLDLVGLKPYVDYMPSALSGGMRKRAGLARALALDPSLLFFDEPSAGLDPITSAELDQLILKLKHDHHVTIMVVSHELDSIFTISDRVILLDSQQGTIIAEGDVRKLMVESPDETVRRFLSRDGLKRKDT